MHSEAAVCGCSAKLAAEDWAGHQRRFHFSRPGYTCTECAFFSPDFADFVGHCFLDGHQVPNNLHHAQTDSLISCIPVPCGGQDGTATCTVVLETSPFKTLIARIDDAEGAGDLPNTIEGPVPAPQSGQTDLTDLRRRVSTTEQGQSSQAFTCSKCGAVVKSVGPKNRHSTLVRHVRSCHNIRPFACSGCGHSSIQSSHIRKHIQSRCPDAGVEKVEEEECQAAVRQGLSRCFPGVEIKLGVGKMDRQR